MHPGSNIPWLQTRGPLHVAQWRFGVYTSRAQLPFEFRLCWCVILCLILMLCQTVWWINAMKSLCKFAWYFGASRLIYNGYPWKCNWAKLISSFHFSLYGHCSIVAIELEITFNVGEFPKHWLNSPLSPNTGDGVASWEASQRLGCEDFYWCAAAAAALLMPPNHKTPLLQIRQGL